MKKISFIIPSAPNRDHTQIIENIKSIHTSHFKNKLTFEILLIKGTWPSAQRNLGIKQSTGDILLFFDDDIIITPETITSIPPHFKNPKTAAVGGPNLTPKNNSFLQHCFGYILSSPFTFANNACRYKKIGAIREVDENKIISCNVALKPEAAKHNLYNEKMFHNEENEWFARIKNDKTHGGKLLYDPNFYIYHHRRPTLKKFIKQIFNWGHGRGEHMLIAPKNFAPIFLIPSLFVIYLVSLPIIANTSISTQLLRILHLPLALYLILNIFFTIQIALSAKSLKSIFIIIWLIPTTHITYGIGLIQGSLHRLVNPNHTPHFNPKTFELIKIELP